MKYRDKREQIRHILEELREIDPELDVSEQPDGTYLFPDGTVMTKNEIEFMLPLALELLALNKLP